MITTTASTHTGGAGFEVGAMMANLEPIWGIEIRPDIAAVAEKNIPGLQVIRADVATINYAALRKPGHLHSSPSCKNASPASDGEEALEDIYSALAICRALRELRPQAFTLENVWFYRTFKSFRLILDTLKELGYFTAYWHLNAADYGVPQIRKRLILIARRDRQPVKPQATHYKPDAKKSLKGMRSLFWQPWVGWYEAIEDLIPDLPESEFAPWQLARLPEEIKTMLVSNASGLSRKDGLVPILEIDEPAMTVTAESQGRVRALLAPGGGNTNFTEARSGKGCRYGDEPSTTVTTITNGGTYPKAFIVDGQEAAGNGNLTIRDGKSPTFTVTGTVNRGMSKAFIVDGQGAGKPGGLVTTRQDDEPVFAITDQGKAYSRAL